MKLKDNRTYLMKFINIDRINRDKPHKWDNKIIVWKCSRMVMEEVTVEIFWKMNLEKEGIKKFNMK